ncbi:MAG: methylmalonyl Co-A mutase-associated GTPase MeaB [Propionibacteriaceae bacterium]|nr:methylmalonyl Co-A mutase-associated GTPase MeaB [Propionibacteriaceae bacterium]
MTAAPAVTRVAAAKLDMTELAQFIRQGSRRHLARAITLVESNRPDDRVQARELLNTLREAHPDSVRVGITGVPGAGKSTFINAMGMQLIEQGHRVAVLAVDPSSTRTGGSILGDRTRMGELAAASEAFIRPSPSGNHLGGVARATRETMLLCEAAGYDVVLIETVGVGQSEVAVAGMVDTFLLITLARAGDQLQGIKRGILEMADVITVNKSDGDNEAASRIAARDLRTAMKLITSDPNARRPPVVNTSSYTGMGLADLWREVLNHRAYLEDHGGLQARRAEQQRDWMWALVDDELVESVRQCPAVKSQRAALEEAVRTGQLSAVEAAETILRTFAEQLPPHWLGGR